MFPNAVALFKVDHQAEYEKFKEQEVELMATNEQKRKAIKLAYSIVTDKRNSDRYAFTAITDRVTLERFGYNEMVETLKAMYNELDGGAQE